MKEVTPRLTEYPALGGSSWPHMGPPGPPQSSPQDLQPSPRELRALPQPPLNLQLGATALGVPFGRRSCPHPPSPRPSAPSPGSRPLSASPSPCRLPEAPPGCGAGRAAAGSSPGRDAGGRGRALPPGSAPRSPGPMKHQVSIMSDWVLLGLIAVLVVLLLLTVFGFAVYSGLFTEVVVSAGSPPIGSITLAYKFRVGPYGESGQLFTDGCSISSKLCSIGVYYDNPHTVSPEKCRFAIGRILSEGDAKPTEEQIRQFQKYGFKIFSFPTPSHVVMASFPFTTPLSIHLAVNRVHPALDTYIKERKLCAHPRLEIYKEDRIYFVCPLARQGDFYVPEMKELERKSRAVAAEAEDAQTDITGADTMSEASTISIEATTDSRDTSVATSVLLPFPAGRGREEADNRSEHSYSESGASGSSFEELDLEGAGDGEGAPGLLPVTAYTESQEVSDKWTKEPIAAERGEE
uniref:Testis expressed 264, ER-phagy receptor n=1 Tax=Anas platyrhynchos platyrhynchos TaxID=8840 RepID=U3J4L8_ANAPP